ncbi:MAG: exodeoxyribonuclease III [Lentisphaeria bacterium]|nr:exodeoxyribonuclease III [Lentisphaeria bacterium]
MAHIISWNVNGLRAVAKKGFLEWFQSESPDILCLQETKAHPDQLDASLLEVPGYHSYWAAAEKRGYSGVAVYSKTEPLRVALTGDDRFDREGRVLEVDYGDFVVLNSYFPNSQAAGARLDYKLAFCDTMLTRCDALRAAGKNMIICGDYNIAHKPIDLKNPKSNEKNPGYLPEERAWMDTFTGSGYVDTFRMFNQEPGHYTWWSYRFRAREKDIGWRIDYHCVNPEFKDRVESSVILNDVMGSDHCPVKLTVR